MKLIYPIDDATTYCFATVIMSLATYTVQNFIFYCEVANTTSYNMELSITFRDK